MRGDQGVFQQSNALRVQAVKTEPSGRDWAMIGMGLAAALAVVAMYVAGVWALVVLVQALV